eukprot:scaffold233558_cov31-Tisochrysis_lutea.AAC.2
MPTLTPAGTSNGASAVQPSNALWPSVRSDAGKSMDTRLVQSRKACSPISYTVPGSSIASSEEQP